MEFLGGLFVKYVVDWILSKLWAMGSGEVKERLAAKEVDKVVQDKLIPIQAIVAEYEAIIASGRQPTKEEIDEIRRRKIAAETDLFNA